MNASRTMTNELTTAEYWDDEWSRISVGRTNRFHYFYGRNGIFLRTLRRHLNNIQGLSVLEVGGARSRFLLSLAQFEAAEVTALDYSAVGIRQTEYLFARNRCRVTAVHADFREWNDGGRRFDLVTHWGVLEHFHDPLPLLAYCAGLLAPGGLVVFSMPNLEAVGARWWRRWSPRNWDRHILHSDRRIEEASRAAGLRVVKRFHWGPPLFRMTRWEQNGVPQLMLTAAQAAALAVDAILPCWHRGHRAISSHRGFILGPLETDPDQ